MPVLRGPRARVLLPRLVAIIAAAAIQYSAVRTLNGGEPSRPEHDHGVIKETIINAWREASARLRAARFEFETHIIVDARQRESIDREAGVKTRTQVVDDKHLGYWRVTRLSFDGPRIRWEILSTGDRAIAPLKRLSIDASDGSRSKSLTVPGEMSALPFPGGYIRKSPHIGAVRLIDMLPIFMAISRLNPDIKKAHGDVLDLDTYKVSDLKTRIGDVECVLLESGDPKARKLVFQRDGKTFTDGIDRHYRQLWLDPPKNYAIVRFADAVNGKLARQIDIRYRQDSDAIWVPATWTINLYDSTNSNLSQIRDSRTTKWESNPTFTASEFDFPPGTMVSDDTSPRADPRTGDEAYILNPDGTKRYVTLQESLKHTYNELLQSNGTRSQSWLRLPLLIALNAIALAIVILAIWWRRKRREDSKGRP